MDEPSVPRRYFERKLTEKENALTARVRREITGELVEKLTVLLDTTEPEGLHDRLSRWRDMIKKSIEV